MESWERIGPGRLVELESWRVGICRVGELESCRIVPIKEEEEKDDDQDDKEDNEKGGCRRVELKKE